MKEYLNKWMYFEILYYKSDFQEIDNLDYLHPDDREFAKNNLTNTFYECIDILDEFLVVRTKNYSLRIKPNLIKDFMPTPKFKWNDRVTQLSKPEIETMVDDFFWHHNDQKYYYYLSVNGKRKSNRYSEEDLK